MEPTQTAHQVHLIEPHVVIATCENIMSSRSTSTRDAMTQQKQALIIAKLVRPNSLEPDLTPYISTQQISPQLTTPQPPTKMLPARTTLRSSGRIAAPMRASPIRTPFQRRFASTDNAFNRERKAVKDHAAATSGE